MKFVFAALFFAAIIATAQAQAPWLPEAEQASLRAMLPVGVPFSDSAKFYKLRQVSQSMYTVSSQPRNDLVPVDDARIEDPWKVSGGMHAVDRRDWRNATALDLLGGKIELWWQYVDAGAFAPVHRRFWKFPVGTLAYDVLIRRFPAGEERVFEVRVHERLKDGWGGARTFRPDVAAQGERWNYRWDFRPTLVFSDLTRTPVHLPASSTIVRVSPIVEQVDFVDRAELVHDDGHLIPKGYVGAGMSCASCHSPNMVGQRTGYQTAIRGNDGRFSWHPWGEDGNIDRRWPVVERKG